MRRLLILFAVFSILQVGCLSFLLTQPLAAQDAADPRDCALPDGPFQLLNPNSCLDDPIEYWTRDPYANDAKVIMMHPEGFRVFGYMINGDGLSGEEYGTGLMSISYDADGYYAFAIADVAGEGGFRSIHMIDEPMCLYIQAEVDYAIEDADYQNHASNYGMYARVYKHEGVGRTGTEVVLDFQAFGDASSGSVDPHWAMPVNAPGVYIVDVAVVMLYPTATGGHVRLHGIAIAENLDGEFCQQDMTR